MMVSQRKSALGSSVIGGCLLGALYSLIVTMACCAITALLLDKEILEETAIGYCVILILLVASFLGSKLAYKKVKQNKLVICIGTGGIYFALLLSVTVVFFDGIYGGVGVSGLLICAGSVLTVLLQSREGRGGRRRMKKYRNR